MGKVADSLAFGGTRGRGDHVDQEDISLPPPPAGDRHEQGSSQEGRLASFCGAAVGHAADLQRDHRAVEGEGAEPHLRDHRWPPSRLGGYRKAFRQDLPRVGFEGARLPSVGHQDQERRGHVPEVAEVGSVGGDRGGHGMDADGCGGLDGRIPCGEALGKDEVHDEGHADEAAAELSSHQQRKPGSHGRDVHGDDAAGEEFDQGSPRPSEKSRKTRSEKGESTSSEWEKMEDASVHQ